jgi:hypothetical protein
MRFNSGRTWALVHGLHIGDFELIARALEDRIASRAGPPCARLRGHQARGMNAGALGAASGLEPVDFCAVPRSPVASVASAMTAAVLREIGGAAQTYVSSISTRGAYVVTP